MVFRFLRQASKCNGCTVVLRGAELPFCWSFFSWETGSFLGWILCCGLSVNFYIAIRAAIFGASQQLYWGECSTMWDATSFPLLVFELRDNKRSALRPVLPCFSKCYLLRSGCCVAMNCVSLLRQASKCTGLRVALGGFNKHYFASCLAEKTVSILC